VDSALAWLGQIADWVGRFFPRWIILDTTEGAVKFEGFLLPRALRRYKDAMRVTVAGPGIHWYWPATTSFQVYPTAVQTDNLPSQTIATADDITISIGGTVTYTVDDLGKLLTQTHSAVKMIQVLTLASIHEVCCRMTWQQLKGEQKRGTLNTKLRRAVQKPLTEFGVRVSYCMLTDLTKTRAHRLIQSMQRDDV
jgi:regulator of protease activity HflC (stomatin/prohibitin superfamily)